MSTRGIFRLIRSVAAFSILLLLIGCGGGGGGGGGATPRHVPVIEDVVFYVWNTQDQDYYATDTLSRGDDWYYDITFSDTGMDAEKVTLTQYYPIDSEVPLWTAGMLFESQTSIRTTFYGVDDYTVPSDAQLGNSRCDFQVEDKAGNKSIVFSQFIKIN